MSSRYYTKRLFKKRPKPGEKPPKKPNSFKSEAAATAWAQKVGIKKFKVEPVANAEKKFKIRAYF